MKQANRNIALLLVLAACAACDSGTPSRPYRNQELQREQSGERAVAQFAPILERQTQLRDAEHVPDARKADQSKRTGQGRICRPCGNWVRSGAATGA